MSEPKAEYNAAVARAAEAIRFEKAMVEETASLILRALAGWQQTQHLSESVLRCAMIQAYERLGEIIDPIPPQ